MKIRPKAAYGAATDLLSFVLVAVAAGACWLVPEDSLALGAEQPVGREVAGSGRADKLPLAKLEGVVIDSGTHQPLAEAKVALEPGRPQATVYGRDREVMVKAVTDRGGRFHFDAVDPGVYTLVAEKPGYVPSPFEVFELAAGKTTTCDVRLDPLAAVSGIVVNESKHPVAGARVGVRVNFSQASASLHRLMGDDSSSALTTTTDRQGNFELFVPAEDGKVTLAARALGYAATQFGPVSVQPGGARKGILMVLPSGLEAQGRVIDETDAPVSGALILARRLGASGDELGPDNLEPQGRSGAEGNFMLRGLEEGTYALTVSHASHTTQTVPKVEVQAEAVNRVPDVVLMAGAEVRGMVTDAQGKPITGARISASESQGIRAEAFSNGDGQFTLGGFTAGAHVSVWAEAAGHSQAQKVVTAPQSGMVLVLPPQGVLRGRVEDAETKAPVGGFRIWPPAAEAKSFRSEDGSFELPGLAPGRWSLVAQAPGYQTAALDDVVIRAGEATEGVIFRLSKGVEVAGRVVDDETDAPLPDVTVSYLDSEELEYPDWSARTVGNTQITDGAGNFKFDGLPSVKVTLIAQSPVYMEARTTLTAGSEDFVEIRLQKGASLSGQVVASDGATPVPGAQVNLGSYASRSGVGILADGAGAFSFDHLTAGRYRLMAQASFGRSKPQDFVLRENERLAGLILVIQSGATILGTVSGIAPGEFQQVEVTVHGHDGFSASGRTQPDGTYTISGIAPGTFEVWAVQAQMSIHSYSDRVVKKSIEVGKAVQQLTLDFEFPPAARLHGQVTRGGQPVPFATVEASSRDSQLATGSGETDQNGMYAIDDLSDGNYVVRVMGKGARRVQISGDTILDIEF